MKRDYNCLVLVGEVPEWVIQGLAKHYICAFRAGPCFTLSGPVIGHIDLMLTRVDDQIFILPEKMNDLEWLCHAMIPLPRQAEPMYPFDVKLSCRTIGKLFICNTRTVSPLVMDYAKKQGYRVIHTQQGYVGCSVLQVSDNAMITDDPSIYAALSKIQGEEGVPEVLFISKGDILLPGHTYGFIGGAAAYLKGCVFFFGDVKQHRDFEKIDKFLKERNVKYFSIYPDMPLLDIGGVFEFTLHDLYKEPPDPALERRKKYLGY